LEQDGRGCTLVGDHLHLSQVLQEIGHVERNDRFGNFLHTYVHPCRDLIKRSDYNSDGIHIERPATGKRGRYDRTGIVRASTCRA